NTSGLTVAVFGQKITAQEIEYQLEFQEYPRTSNTGVATVYNISTFEDENQQIATKVQDAFALKNIQYAYGDPGNIKKSIKCPFLGVKTRREYRTCQGIKVCECASSDLEVSHTS
ncbi:29482_t:CDS:1, partial [Racocetra persica]